MKNLLKLSLQHFAEGDSAASEGANGNAVNQTGESTADSKEPTFDDMLKNKTYQAEFDRRVTKALETAKERWDSTAKAQQEEAQKLAKMNTEQKAQYENAQAAKKLSEREAAVTKRELTMEAKSILIEKGLPAELSDVLDYSSADKCKDSIESVSKAFNLAVEKAVNERMKGSVPKKGEENSDDKMATMLRAAAGLK